VGIDAHLEVFFVGDHRFDQFIEMRVNAPILRSIVPKHRAGDVLDQFNRMRVRPRLILRPGSVPALGWRGPIAASSQYPQDRVCAPAL